MTDRRLGGRSDRTAFSTTLLAWLPVIAWGAAVWSIGGIQDTSAAPGIPHLDKVAHFGMYGVLGWLGGRAARGTRIPAAVAVVVLMMALGAADELRQGRLPGRSMDPKDWIADVAGAVTGFVIGRRRKAHMTNSGTDPIERDG